MYKESLDSGALKKEWLEKAGLVESYLMSKPNEESYHKTTSIDKNGIPITAVFKVPYQNFVQIIVPGADLGKIDPFDWAKIHNVYYGIYHNQELLQVNFTEGTVGNTGNEYTGYASAYEVYKGTASNLSSEGGDSATDFEIDDIKSNCVYYKTSSPTTQTTIEGETYNLLKNNEEAASQISTGNNIFTCEINLTDYNSKMDTVEVESAKITSGGTVIEEINVEDVEIKKPISNNKVIVSYTKGNLTAGIYDFEVNIIRKRELENNIGNINGVLVYDDVEESNTAGLFGIYVGESLSEYIGEGLNLTWNDGDKESSNIIHVRKNNKDYYMVYDSSSKVLYFAPGAKLNGEPINEVVDEYTKDVFKSMFSGNCEIFKTISGTATQNITG